MRRTELEQRLTQLGWVATGETSGNHVVWRHPNRVRPIYVRRVDILNVHTANAIIEEAGG